MDTLSLVAGIALLALGCFDIYMLRTNPAKFGQRLKGLWSIKTGIAISIVFEIIVPIGLGIFFIVMGIKGVSIFSK